MAENNTKKPRMYDPWGYQDENNYQSSEIIMENDLDSFFVDAAYNKDDNKIHFTNKDGEELVTIDVSEFDKSDKIIEKAWYEDGKIYIKFTNGDLVTIDVEELIDENEFKGGLQVNDGVVSILIDPSTEPYITASDDGLKVSGIDAAIAVETNRAESAETALQETINAESQRAQSAETSLDEKIEAETARATSAETTLDEKVDAETARAESAESDLQAAIEAEGQRAQNTETALDAKIDQEIADRTADVDAEETRAKAREDEIETALNAEITRATQTEQGLNHRIDLVNDELDSEESRAQAAEQELRTLLTNEIADRKADVDEEEARAKAAEEALQNAIEAEETRALSAETALLDAIDTIEATLDEKISALRTSLNNEITRATTKEEELENNDIASGSIASDATISITKNNGDVITFTSADEINIEAGEF